MLNVTLRWRRAPQPPHQPRIADVSSGYPEDLELYGSPDTVNVEDILSVEVMPLSSISASGMDATTCRTCLWLGLCLSNWVHQCQ